MGKISRNILDEGFTVTYDDGTKESFQKNVLDDNWHGSKGSKINAHILDHGFTVYKYDGSKESFQKNVLDENWHGSSGTHLDKNILDNNIHTYNNSKRSRQTSNEEKMDLSWMDADQHSNNLIGAIACVVNGIVMRALGMGAGRVIITSLIMFFIVAGLLDIKKMNQKKKYSSKVRNEETAGMIIAAIIMIPIYLLIIGAYFGL